MPATARTEIVGVREAIRSLNKVEPGLRKEFQANATRIAEPAITEARNSYPDLPLSGMARRWTQNGRRIFPYDVARARRGVRIRLDAGRNALAVINIQQADVGASVYEAAGRRTVNLLGNSLGTLEPNKTRVLGPAVYRKLDQITGEMRRLVLDAIDTVNRELR